MIFLLYQKYKININVQYHKGCENHIYFGKKFDLIFCSDCLGYSKTLYQFEIKIILTSYNIYKHAPTMIIFNNKLTYHTYNLLEIQVLNTSHNFSYIMSHNVVT